MREASIATALGEAAADLERAGVLNPRREATAIWAALEGTKPGDVWLKREGDAPAEVAEEFWEAVRLRVSQCDGTVTVTVLHH